MHVDPSPSPPTNSTGASTGSWTTGLTRYHWFVFFVAALGWLFDTMDQQLFLLARNPAVQALLETTPTDPRINEFSGYVTMIFMMGWAIGGLGFGILGDRIGRARTMMITILVYSVFTGLSAVSVSVWDFAVYRFLTGLGVGGEFAVGVALVAEVMPDRSRPFALGWLQALSAVGNITAALISMLLGYLQLKGVIKTSWQIMFVIGALPALLTLLIMRRLKEPERWKAVATEEALHKQLGSLSELFGTPRWRRNAIVGMLLAFAGVVGLWGIGFFSFELVRSALRKPLEDESRKSSKPEDDIEFVRLAIQSDQNIKEAGDRILPSAILHEPSRKVYQAALDLYKKEKPVTPPTVAKALDNPKEFRAVISGPSGEPEAFDEEDERVTKIEARSKEIEGGLMWWAGVASVLQNIGAFCGIYLFSRLTHFTGRKPAFAIAFVLAMLSTAFTFWFLRTFSDVFWMIPLMGFCQLSLFGGYAIYFPELFPTRLRSTGTSFCYNVGRFVAAVGPLTLGLLSSKVFTGPDRLRYAGVTMCVVFLIGLCALPFAPETKGKPLPE
jgi:MFS family permease